MHFHDVEDDATGWLTTKELTRPNGWAFRALGDTWDAFEASLRSRLEAQHDLTAVKPYLYEVHDLDQIVAIVEAASGDATSEIARTLFEHLARHWSWLVSFADCRVALVERGKWPGQRSKPQRALAEELADGGDNLWVQRLRSRSICPTRLGPRAPALTWRPTAELERRFSRRGRSSAALLPVLDVPEGISNRRRALAVRAARRAPRAVTVDVHQRRRPSAVRAARAPIPGDDRRQRLARGHQARLPPSCSSCSAAGRLPLARSPCSATRRSSPTRQMDRASFQRRTCSTPRPPASASAAGLRAQ